MPAARPPRRSPPLLTLVVLGLVLLGSACAGSPKLLGPVMPDMPSANGRCRVAANQFNPIVTEWPASEKANLEALLRGGSVAVTYSGCSMRILPQCRVAGGYLWQRTTPSADLLELNNEDDLYAKIPLGAASLAGELKRSGKLSVQTYVSGHLRLADAAVTSIVPQDGECAKATHIVGSLAIGAFSLTRGGMSEVNAQVAVTGIAETGGSRTRNASLVRSAGDPQACGTSSDEGPNPNCSSPIQVFLWPIPGRSPELGPPGTVPVDFVSANASSRWDVYVDDQVVCTTPCTKWVNPSHPVLMRTREEGFMRSSDKIRVNDLGPDAAAGSAVQLRANATSNGKLVTGITFAAFGGMAIMSGILFTSLGYGADRDGMGTAGLITLGAGAVVTAGSVWLILDALPKAEVLPRLDPSFQMTLGQTRATVHVGPGMVFGSF